MSHYVGACLVALYRPQPFGGGGLDYLVDVGIISAVTLGFSTLVIFFQRLTEWLIANTPEED